jgi:hypothetical protein
MAHDIGVHVKRSPTALHAAHLLIAFDRGMPAAADVRRRTRPVPRLARASVTRDAAGWYQSFAAGGRSRAQED